MIKINIKDRDILLLIGISLINLLIHLLTNGQYGFHRDELYVIDCSKHLAFGYRDMPPLTPFLAKLTLSILGETLRGLRFLPALFSSIIVFLTGLITKEMGGKLFAQILASLTVIVAPIYLISGMQFQTIIIDQFFWILTCYLYIKFLNTSDQKYWLLIGLVIGLGLLAKYSIAFLALAVLVGIITSNQRTIFRKYWIWIGAFICLIVFLPNIIWQFRNGFPVFEHLQALQDDEYTPTSQFLIEQMIFIHPLTIPIWISGIFYLLFSESAKKYRTLVWIYFIPFFVFLVLKGKSYYVAPAYIVLLASGSILLEKTLLKRQLNWPKYAIPIFLIIISVITSPLWLPILPIEKLKKYGIDQLRYNDMIGWPELVDSVYKVYNDLPEEEKKSTIIITGNYGEAGSINHFGPKYGLPVAVSGISSYYDWGPGNPDATTVLFVGYSEEFLKTLFSYVRVIETFKNNYEINNEEQGILIILCKKPNIPIGEMWPEFRHM